MRQTVFYTILEYQNELLEGRLQEEPYYWESVIRKLCVRAQACVHVCVRAPLG